MGVLNLNHQDRVARAIELQGAIAAATAELATLVASANSTVAALPAPSLPAASTRLLSLKQVAERISKAEITIKRMVERKKFPPPLPHERGTHLRFREHDIEQWLARVAA